MNKPKYINKKCKNHGTTSFVLEGRGYYRCRKCRSDAVTKRRKKMKQKAVDALGGRCYLCGYNKCITALEFHHIDDDKEFDISRKGSTSSWAVISKELKKCKLVCANCHREIHSEEIEDLKAER